MMGRGWLLLEWSNPKLLSVHRGFLNVEDPEYINYKTYMEVSQHRGSPSHHRKTSTKSCFGKLHIAIAMELNGLLFSMFWPPKNAFDVDNRVIWVLDKVVIQKGQRYQIGGVKSILTNYNSSAWGLGIKNTLQYLVWTNTLHMWIYVVSCDTSIYLIRKSQYHPSFAFTTYIGFWITQVSREI
jgi:hypothetical protein